MNKATMGYKKQRGAVLAVSLVLLLVLTVLGVATMDTSGLELKMASNSREHQVAFQAAEAGLLEGEKFIDGITTTPSNFQLGCSGSNCFTLSCANGLCFNGNYPVGGAHGDCTYNVPLIEVWDNPVIWATSSNHVVVNPYGSAQLPNPKYIIEFLCYTDAGNGIFDTTNDNGAELYRITALGAGLGGRGRVMLQSTYRKIKN